MDLRLTKRRMLVAAAAILALGVIVEAAPALSGRSVQWGALLPCLVLLAFALGQLTRSRTGG